MAWLDRNGKTFLVCSMPMRTTRTRDRDTFYLSNAHSTGTFIRVTCGGCSPPRLYVPEDLIKLFGDIAVIDLDNKMRCERCGYSARARTFNPAASERIGLVCRRLDEVRMVRKVRWREEKL